jgi:hypothetical protein
MYKMGGERKKKDFRAVYNGKMFIISNCMKIGKLI